MATKKTNLEIIADALAAEYAAGKQELKGDDLVNYMDALEEVIGAVRKIKRDYSKELAVLASQKSRANRKERVAKALALLAETEAKEGASE